MTKEECKIIKNQLKYVTSSVDSWTKSGDHYNFEMVIKTLDGVKEKIIKSNNEHLSSNLDKN